MCCTWEQRLVNRLDPGSWAGWGRMLPRAHATICCCSETRIRLGALFILSLLFSFAKSGTTSLGPDQGVWSGSGSGAARRPSRTSAVVGTRGGGGVAGSPRGGESVSPGEQRQPTRLSREQRQEQRTEQAQARPRLGRRRCLGVDGATENKGWGPGRGRFGQEEGAVRCWPGGHQPWRRGTDAKEPKWL